MKGLAWGPLYDQYGDGTYDTKALETEISQLLIDDDVTSHKGVYSYVLTRNEKYLSIRAFSEAQKIAAYERQGGICPKCGKRFEMKKMEADHITPWSKSGKTTAENCQMLCADCNRRKSDV
jgi:5-methylcytosine-specific restriction endonuclease McrA